MATKSNQGHDAHPSANGANQQTAWKRHPACPNEQRGDRAHYREAYGKSPYAAGLITIWAMMTHPVLAAEGDAGPGAQSIYILYGVIGIQAMRRRVRREGD